MDKDSDRHVYVPDDIRLSLEKYAEAEKKRQTNPLIKEMITWKSLALHILRNDVVKRGFYQGKAGKK